MSTINYEIKLKRENKIYYEGDLLTGCVQFHCPSEAKHDGILLTLEGIVNLQLSTKNVAIFDAFYSSVKPIQLLNATLELAPPGKLAHGNSEFHFELPLVCSKEPRILYETYHGIFINISYQLRCDVRRSFLAKSLQKTQQFCIQYKPTPLDGGTTASQISLPTPIPAPGIGTGTETGASCVRFSISPETLQKHSKERVAATIPRFHITGQLDQTDCCLTKPLKGNLTVLHTEVAIRSIELQLVRVETCGCTEGFSKDATEIQTLQIVDGNISPNIQIPIHMLFPRLFTCPTLITKNFKIEFELNLIVLFKDDYMVSENFPLTLKRTTGPLDKKQLALRQRQSSSAYSM